MLLEITKNDIDENRRYEMFCKNLEQVCLGKALIDESLFKKVKSEISYAKRHCSEQRMLNNLSSGGWSKDKESMAATAIPRSIYWQIDYFLKRFKDPMEREKAQAAILNQLPAFHTKEKKLRYF